MSDTLLKAFQSPSNAYRGKPFWSWNGKLEKDELLRQIQVLKGMGMGGYFMHSRTGLITEYMGEEWMDLINTCADEGERLGMESWLYDEDRWPSGTAGGMVTKEPRYRLKHLFLDVKKAEEFTWSDELVAAFSCQLDGINYTNLKQLAKDTPASEYAGQSILTFVVEEQEPQSFYNGFTYVDTLNREAIDRYLELTHEKYKTACGDRLGRSIKGIFTDEPHRGALMDGFSLANKKPEWRAPWTYKLFDQFRERFGYDLVPRLPELFLRPDGQRISPVKWHYCELIQQMFLDNFAKPINEWCQKHNIILTGHVLHEDSLTAQVVMQGSLMRFYEHMGYPGVDVLTEQNYNFWIVKQLASAARQVGQKWLLSELYGCTGWQMPFGGHKAIGDWQALFGINLRCQHLSWYTMEGEAKRDFPASIFYQSAWWQDYHHLETYFSRIHVMMSQGQPCCDVLVLNPVESVWSQVYPGWSRWLGAQSPEVNKLEEAYRNLFHWLAGAQIDFDYGDEEMVGRLSAVERDGKGCPVLRVGQAVYKTVVVSGMETIRATSVKLLKEFIAAGGQVIFAGEIPAYVDAVASTAASELAQTATRVAFERDALVQAVEAAAAPAVKLTLADGSPATEIFCQLRQDGERRILMALNVNRTQAFAGVTVRIAGEGAVEEWNCLTGERAGLATRAQGGSLEFTTDFAAGGEHLYVIAAQADPALKIAPALETAAQEEIAGPFNYRLSEPNVCVLDFAKFQVNGGEWEPAQEILKVDRVVRDRFGLPYRGGEMLQPWFVKQGKVEVLGQVALRFAFTIETLPQTPIELVMERPEYFSIKVNGHTLSAANDQGWWVDKAFRRLAIPGGALRLGRNEVEIQTGYHASSGFEALYLLGHFGVKLEGVHEAVLTTLPARLALGDIVNQGLPFYSGVVTYELPAVRQPGAGELVYLRLPKMEAACAKVSAEGFAERLIGWSPFEAEVTAPAQSGSPLLLDVVLTRRNSFGPLHQTAKVCAGYGPDNFTTSGADFTESYQLYEAGLLAAPVVEVRRPRD